MKLNSSEQKVVVSLTSFPARIDYVWICIESIIRQSVKPDLIILWLAESQFRGLDSLPTKLLQQQGKGLKIIFCDDLRSHKKYYYAFNEYPNDLVITFDDDVYYPKDTIKELIEIHEKFPDCICCNRGHIIKMNKDKTIAPYREWETNNKNYKNPSKLIFPTGVGGVLYPPKSVDSEVFNKENIVNLCFFADDLWLKIMSLKNKTNVVKTKNFPDTLFTIKSSQKESLAKVNVLQNKNDEQLQFILEEYKSFNIINEIYEG
jgi:hypothetical protein